MTFHPLMLTQAAVVAHLKRPDTQVDFVGDIAEMANDPDPKVQMHLVKSEEKVVGFFKIDLDFTRKIPELPKNALGLRGLLVGGQYQGLGYGKQLLAMLPQYLRRTYTRANEIWLSVDLANHAAIHCYEAAGWTTYGALRDGRCGKERVLRLLLSETP